ncbi:MAG: hypothetical protein EPN31_15315 [Castellaniella sp.]|uniref:HipA domain-containing protein n=1 Tax=Castellaniella sp. TaxID=1955812 RepID=UPI00120B5000|nr:HipA domain-containing protein [Castellaniella sp.]TAN25488.1 MAG: hypothetical protein EPN31_15315 [Castellaniella sp.]
MQNRTADERRLLEFLTRQGLASSNQIQSFLGKSQSAVSRLLAVLDQEVTRIGRARSTRYSIPRKIHGLNHEQSLYWTDSRGTARQIGTLMFLTGDLIHVQAGAFETTTQGLPWYLSSWKLEGFLGRLQAQRLATQGLDGNPDHWNTEDVLYSALQIGNHTGALEIGELSATEPPPVLPPDAAMMDQTLDEIAEDVSRTLPAGSSAGGEQPKFLALLTAEPAPSDPSQARPALIKFSPPLGTPFGDRWHDLLQAESLAGQVLSDHGIASARSRFQSTGHRAYLISERFDRVGARGRRHVIAIGSVHRGLLEERYTHWGDTARALARIGRLRYEDMQRTQSVFHFGRLIGNADMHGGNLSFFVEPDEITSGPLEPAPIYDMLPMIWKPNPALGLETRYSPFAPDERALGSTARPMALDFWDRLGQSQAVSQPMRETARSMADRCRPSAT